MLQITKQGNSIVVEGLNHYFYPYNGTLEVPCNSVITVVDEADIVLFRSAANYDVLFSAKIDEITIDGQSVTKDNVGLLFGELSNTSYGGGGLTPDQEEKLNNAVQISDYNADKATQTTIDEAQNAEINKLKGDIAGKQDIIQDLNAIREGAALGKTALQNETDPVWTAEKVNYYTKTEVNSSLETKANKSEIPTVPTNVSAFTNDAGYLTEHQSLDNYYTKTESDGKYATQVVVNEEIAARISDIRNVNASLEAKADKSEIPSLNGYATEQWVGQQGYLTEHQTLKTINGETIVGDGNIEIQGGGSDVYSVIITDFTFSSYVKFYATKNSVPLGNAKLSITAIGTNDYNTSISKTSFTLYTKDDGYVETPKLDLEYYHFIIEMYYNNNLVYKTTLCNFYNIQRWLKSGTNIKTINGESILGRGDLVISGGGEETDPIWTAEKVNYYTKTEVNSSLETKANKSEIPTVPTNVSAFTNDAGYLTQHQTLKTINGETIIGEGDITISGGEETDPVWTAEKGNYYTKTEVNTSLESKANKSEIPTVPTKVSEFTNDAGYLTEHQSLDNYYTKSEINTSLESKANKNEIPTVPTKVSEFTNDAGYLTQHQTLKTINGETIVGDGNIEITSGKETDPIWNAEKVNYYTKMESDGIYATQVAMNEEIAARKADIREVNASLETKANKSEIPTVPTNVSAFTNDAGYLTEHQSLDNYYTKSQVDTSLESKANKSEIPTVPTNVSAFTNDAGYLTQHQSLSNYYTKSEIDGIVGNVNNALSEIING